MIGVRVNPKVTSHGVSIWVYPPEWKIDLEKAERIESEIRQRLAELNELFKLD